VLDIVEELQRHAIKEGIQDILVTENGRAAPPLNCAKTCVTVNRIVFTLIELQIKRTEVHVSWLKTYRLLTEGTAMKLNIPVARSANR
jgi:hypothetical protein